MTARNGHPSPAPTPPKPKGRRKRLKKFLVLEIVDTIEAATFEEVQARVNESFPDTREFLIEELKG